MKKILVITTGGTIAMKKDRETGGLIPAVSGKDLAAAVPGLAHYADLDVLEFSNKPSGWFCHHPWDGHTGRDSILS